MEWYATRVTGVAGVVMVVEVRWGAATTGG
jgi:hypothetical protein